MLIGEYESKLGLKNRIAIPKKIRENLNTDLIVTKGYENCLILTDQKLWRKLIKSIEIKPLLTASIRDLKRFLVGGAQEIELDNQGRFVLSKGHAEYADIKSEIVFIGIEDWVEIWDKQKWNEKIEVLSKTVSDLAERLGELS